MKELRHILSLLATILLMAALASCVSDDHWDYVKDDPDAKEGWITLTLQPIGEYDALPDIEKIHNYQILIVSLDDKDNPTTIDAIGSGEVGTLFLASPEAGESGEDAADAKNSVPTQSVPTLTYPVKFNPTGKKRVYAIANYDMTDVDLKQWKDGGDATAAVNAIENCTFTFQDGKNIPFFGTCDVDFKYKDDNNTVNADLYLVRVATKFEFTITNNRSEDITVTDLTLHNLADKQYLKPHFTSGYGVISNTGHQDFYFGLITDPFNKSEDSLSWDAWLAKAVEESHIDIQHDDIADQRGWIMEYTSPVSQENHKSHSWSDLTDENAKIESNKSCSLPVHYYAESAYLMPDNLPVVETGENIINRLNEDHVINNPIGTATVMNARKLIHDDAQGLQQYYYFSITFTDSDGKPHTFLLDFYNLRALFRNTDVRVDITVGGGEQTEVEWRVYTRNWHVRIQPEIVL